MNTNILLVAGYRGQIRDFLTFCTVCTFWARLTKTCEYTYAVPSPVLDSLSNNAYLLEVIFIFFLYMGSLPLLYWWCSMSSSGKEQQLTMLLCCISVLQLPCSKHWKFLGGGKTSMPTAVVWIGVLVHSVWTEYRWENSLWTKSFQASGFCQLNPALGSAVYFVAQKSHWNLQGKGVKKILPFHLMQIRNKYLAKNDMSGVLLGMWNSCLFFVLPQSTIYLNIYTISC